MTWFDQRIYAPSEVMLGGTLDPLPSNHQIGDEVALNLYDENNNLIQIPCIVGGVSIGDMNEVRYSLLFELKCGFFVKLESFRGHVSKRGEVLPPDGGLVNPSELTGLRSSPPLKLATIDGKVTES